MAQRAAPNRTPLRLLLPPLLLARAPLTPACLHPGAGECNNWRGSSREAPGSLGAHLAPSESPPQRGVSEHCQHLECPSYSFLPDLRGPMSPFQNSLTETLPHEIHALGSLRREHAQFKKANNSSGEGSGRGRRCPFRVRFADETLRDTARRYWERSCALQQGVVENAPATQSAASEPVCHSVGRWLESLPNAEAMAGSLARWDCPGLPLPEQQDHTPEVPENSNLPFIPRATTQRRQRDLKTFLGVHSLLEQASFLPQLVLHKVRKRGGPKGYQRLLPSIRRQRAQR